VNLHSCAVSGWLQNIRLRCCSFLLLLLLHCCCAATPALDAYAYASAPAAAAAAITVSVQTGLGALLLRLLLLSHRCITQASQTAQAAGAPCRKQRAAHMLSTAAHALYQHTCLR
jgi:hypothetical protein